MVQLVMASLRDLIFFFEVGKFCPAASPSQWSLKKGLSGSAKCRHRGRGVHLLEVQDGGSRIVEQVHVGDSPWACSLALVVTEAVHD